MDTPPVCKLSLHQNELRTYASPDIGELAVSGSGTTKNILACHMLCMRTGSQQHGMAAHEDAA